MAHIISNKQPIDRPGKITVVWVVRCDRAIPIKAVRRSEFLWVTYY